MQWSYTVGTKSKKEKETENPSDKEKGRKREKYGIILEQPIIIADEKSPIHLLNACLAQAKTNYI